MRAKNEFKQLSEAYQQVINEDTGKRYQLVSVGGEFGQIENVEGEFDNIDGVIDHIDLPNSFYEDNPEWGNWFDEIKDPSNWSAEGFEDGLIRFGIGEIYEVIDTQSAEDDEGWGRVAKGALLGSILGKGAVTGGLAGAAYDALKDKPKKKKEDKEDKGFTKGGW